MTNNSRYRDYKQPLGGKRSCPKGQEVGSKYGITEEQRTMKAEQRELYVYAKDHFSEDLKRISPDCVSPIIATRQIVKRAIDKYCADYCTNNESPFSKEDFQAVSNNIRDEIMNGAL